MTDLDPAALDRWIAGGRYRRDQDATVFCHNKACADYGEPQGVMYEEEYGAGWYTPEECPACGGEWSEESPPDVEVYLDGRRV